MGFMNLFIKHDRTPEVEEWIKEEAAEQEARFEKIVKQMDDIAPQRDKWYQEFFDRITTIGFNVDGDMKQKIKPEELPIKPKDAGDRVIWKYGVDSE